MFPENKNEKSIIYFALFNKLESVRKILEFKFNNLKFLIIQKKIQMRGKQPVKGGLKKKIERPGLTEDEI